MAERIRAFDWSGTPLGPLDGWPQSLRTAVDLMLAARQPVYVAWGVEVTSLYNDGYIPILGTKHPDALAKSYRELWAEIWDEYRPVVEATMAGEAHYFVDQPVMLVGRPGQPMSWFTFSWTPLRDEAGAVAGFFCVATETTGKVRAEAALRERNERALREREERYRTLFESIDGGFCILEMIFDGQDRPVDYRFVEANPAFERHTGLVGAIGRTARELVPDLESHWFEIYGKVALTGEPTRFVDHAQPMGRWFDVYAFRVGEPRDRQVALLFNDITERKGVEERLRESEERFRLMTSAVPQIVWITDADGRAEFFNRQWTLYTGEPYRPTSATDVAQSFVHPDDRLRTMAAFEDARRTGQVFQVEHRIRSAAGEYRWFLVRAEPYRDPRTGQILRWFGVSIDIHDRKLAEERLRESERRLEAVLNNATVGVILLDDGQRCSYMNAAAEELTGYTLAEAQGRVMHDVVHHTRPDGSPFPLAECPIDHAFPEDRKVQGEEIFVHKDGRFYPVAFTASPVHDEAARTIGTILEIRDIGAEKQAQERQQLLINELNHRVKNTLATVQSIASQTLRNAPDLQEAKDSLEGRLIALARAHDVLTRESWEGAELREIVAQTVAPYSSRGENRLHARGPEMRLPPRMALALAMALQELATNAVKYGALSNATGEIAINWSVDGSRSPAHLRLRWEESGGPPVQAPTRRGFGSRLIERSLSHDLGGEVRMTFAPTGLVCTVDAPLA